MKLRITIIFILNVLSFNVFAQYYQDSRFSGIGTPVFEYNINRQFSIDFKTSTVLIFSGIIYDDITFIKSDSTGFDAELEWLIAVYKEDRLIFSRTVTKTINVPDYKQTNSREDKLNIDSEIPLESGEYQVLMRMIDLNTKKSAQTRVDLEIPQYYDENIALSDILFLESAQFDSSGKMISYSPILSDNFAVREGEFYVYFNVYSQKTGTDAQIEYLFSGTNNKTDFDSVTTQYISDTITPCFLKVNKNIFEDNSYRIEITVEIDGHEAQNKKNITFYWSGVPNNTTDINDALNQMVYIIPSDSLSYYLEASLEEKQGYFKRFWRKRDPDPKTEKNELMDEYFTRINYANENFTSFGTQGWLTDRGRILIKFGHPDDIERHPFELETRPYVIWRYYSIRKVFLFEDYTGFGDYRLHPTYVNEEFQ